MKPLSPMEDKVMNVLRTIRNYRNYRRTVAQLNALSNRQLDDLGIVRGDIPEIVRIGR